MTVATPKPSPRRRRVGPVQAAVEHMLANIDLDDVGLTNAAIAKALAAKLDEAQGADSGAVAMAVAGIAKELRSTVEAIFEATNDTNEFVADLFGKMGDAADG